MSPAYKRWYDHDPKLLEVIELLKNYQAELKAHAVVFLDKLEQKVSKAIIKIIQAKVVIIVNNVKFDENN